MRADMRGVVAEGVSEKDRREQQRNERGTYDNEPANSDEVPEDVLLAGKFRIRRLQLLQVLIGCFPRVRQHSSPGEMLERPLPK
jgi:hypothetical protein